MPVPTCSSAFNKSYLICFPECRARKLRILSSILSEDSSFEAAGLTVVPIQVYHKDLPIWGFRIGELTYITDAKSISKETVAKIQGTTVLIVNALQKKLHPSHFSLQEAVSLAQKVNAKVTYLTHISHHLGFHQEVSKELPSNIHLAYDGLQISV